METYFVALLIASVVSCAPDKTPPRKTDAPAMAPQGDLAKQQMERPVAPPVAVPKPQDISFSYTMDIRPAVDKNGIVLNNCLEALWEAVRENDQLRKMELKVEDDDKYGNTTEVKIGVVAFTTGEIAEIRKYKDLVSLLSEEGCLGKGSDRGFAYMREPYEQYMGPTARKIYAVIKKTKYRKYW
jgi:hypothetical protein